MQKRIKINFIILIFFIINIQTLAFLWLKNNLSNEIKKIMISSEDSMEKTYKSVILNYKNWSNFIFENFIKENQYILLNLSLANEFLDIRDKARGEIYQNLLPLYDQIKKKNISFIHFHLPDGTSLLRFHAPDRYGDNLLTTRETIRRVNTEKTPIDGFEIGYTTPAYRFVYPIFYRDKYIGSVELSLDSQHLIDIFYELNSGIYDLIFNKKFIMSDYTKNYIPNNNITESNINNNFLLFQKNYRLNNDSKNLNEKINISNKYLIYQKLKKNIELNINNNKNFSLYTKIDNNYYLISFISIQDIINNKIGYIIKINSDENIKHQHRLFFINIFFITLFNIILILYFFIHYKNKERELYNKDLIDKNRKFLQIIMDNIPDAILIIDFEGRIISTNKSTERIFQSDQFKLIDKKIFDVLNCLNIKFNINTEDLSNENHFIFSKKFECPLIINQNKIVLSISFSKINIGFNDIKILCIISDITELKNNIEKINIFSKLVEQTPLSIVITDNSGNIEYVNPKFENITGFKREEVLGKNPRILKSGKLSKEYYKNLWDTISSGETWTGEFHNKKKNGDFYWEWVIIFPIKNENNEISHYAAIKEDITEKKYLNELLETTRNQLEFLFDNLAIGIALIKNHSIYKVNKTALQMFGYSSYEEVIGNLSEIAFISKDHYQNFDEIYNEKIMKGELIITEEYLTKKNGEHFWVRLFGRLVNPSNVDEGEIWLIEDISEQKKLHEELIMAKIIAEKANQAKSAFLANMSHEIRTPINAIIGMTELSLEKSNDDEQKNYLKTVIDSSEFLLNILNEILDFSKIEAGKYEIEIMPFCLKNLMETIINTQQVLAKRKNLKFITEININSEYYLLGDPHNLSKILINLIGNAIKFTEKGLVRVICNLTESSDDTFQLFFSVEDTGIGISEEKIRTIFEPFSQGDISVTKKFGGTGLGLAITKKLVDLMGGEIHVESRLGEGSIFSVKIFLKRGEKIPPYNIENKQDNETDILVKNELGDLKNINILVAEDNKTNQELLKIILENLDLNVKIAENGLEVLRFLADDDYNLILMDIQMPIMDGLTTMGIIRAFEKGEVNNSDDIIDIKENLMKRLKNKHNNIIILTAHAIDLYRDESLKLGADEYLTKPIRKKDLLKVLNKFIKIEDNTNNILSDKNIQSIDEKKIKNNNSINIIGTISNYIKSNYDLSDENIEIIIDNSKKTLKDLLNKLNKNITDSDLKNIFKTAHSIKGALLNIGLYDISEIAKQIEISARKNELIDYLKLYLKLKNSLINFIDFD